MPVFQLLTFLAEGGATLRGCHEAIMHFASLRCLQIQEISEWSRQTPYLIKLCQT